ncbi:MAG: molybdopterin converting factor subunit 1 [Bacteroidota bacterium]|nr:molybdopterin converting factor subunit 1 [Bacteroidota bacterium]
MEVILFGISREIVGEKKVTVHAAENIQTVGALKQWMRQKYPQLQKLTSIAVAVDSEYADDEQLLLDGNEVAIIPPVSGG